MDLLLLLTYTAICIFIFKVFKIPLNKWTVPTAGLGGVILIGVLVLVMNYNHPFSNLERGKADLERAQITFEAGIDGENPDVARIRAELEKARYDVERTIIRAPTSGYVSQLLLRPGMMAVSLPLRPVMVFVHDEKAPMVAAFRQNSALRLKAGYEAEIVFPGIPGRVFKGKVKRVLPNLAEGQMQASGILIGTAQAFQSVGRIPVFIEILDDMSEFNLPTGSRAQVAVYSDHFHHVAIMRRILLRMSSWENYLYLDHLRVLYISTFSIPFYGLNQTWPT